MKIRNRNSAFTSIDPFTGQFMKKYAEHRWKEVQQILYKVRRGTEMNAATPINVRSEWMNRLADLLISRKKNLAELITSEMGKPIRQSVAEIEKCALVCQYYAKHAADFLQDDYIETTYTSSVVRHLPVGVILAIMPWNFPFWQVFRFGAAALMAGNGIVLKHAPNVPQCAMAIQDLIHEAGFPAETFQVVFVSDPKSRWLIEAPQIDALSFTGSNATAAKIGEIAGRCGKKMVMELGGSDAFIVLDDANIRETARAAIHARMVNNGQSCIAAKRFIVLDTVAHEFIGEILRNMKLLHTGNPMLETTDVGPIARHDLIARLEEQVNLSVKMGARIIFGGPNQTEKDTNDLFFPPTVMLHVDRDMPVMQEEIFGPVMPICTARSIDDAVRIANDTPYGLAASIWTNDTERALEIAKRLRVGTTFINSMVVSDPQLPFGGTKHSGYGRELGKEGILEFTYTQTIVVK
jgi:succinate-semialdehyde dehydrogenase/glutarate-semialdehyde dehydrogenase